MSHRTTDKNLVPEQADEVEEGAQDGQHERHAHASDAPGPGVWSPSTSPGSSPLSTLSKIDNFSPSIILLSYIFFFKLYFFSSNL